jgi:hypothetical protein
LNRGRGAAELERVAAAAGDPIAIEVPSNYGQVFVTPAPDV